MRPRVCAERAQTEGRYRPNQGTCESRLSPRRLILKDSAAEHTCGHMRAQVRNLLFE